MIDFSSYKGCSVDISGLQRRYGAERTINLLRLFVTESDARVAELERGARERSAPIVAMVAHSLKGVSSMLRASSIEGLCRLIEQKSQAGDWIAVNELVEDLKSEFAQVRREMGPDL